jgi:cytochrome b561
MAPRYSRLSIALHWTMAAAIGLAWVLGQVMDEVGRGLLQVTLSGSHALIGLAVLALVLPRALARRWPRSRSPPGRPGRNAWRWPCISRSTP